METASTNQLQAPVMTTAQWVGTLLLTAIPVANIVLLFVWAFGNTNPNKSNWAKANLIILAGVMALYLLIFLVFFFLIGSQYWY